MVARGRVLGAKAIEIFPSPQAAMACAALRVWPQDLRIAGGPCYSHSLSDPEPKVASDNSWETIARATERTLSCGLNSQEQSGSITLLLTPGYS